MFKINIITNSEMEYLWFIIQRNLFFVLKMRHSFHLNKLGRSFTYILSIGKLMGKIKFKKKEVKDCLK